MIAPPKPLTPEQVRELLARGASSARELDEKLRQVFCPPSSDLLLRGD